jgi:hypothetical protein
MKKNPEKQAYYKALENAIIITLAPLEGLRKDTAAKLILGGSNREHSIRNSTRTKHGL